MERPAPGVPSTLVKLSLVSPRPSLLLVHVGEIDIANVRETIQAEHGIDRFREFRAARFVDANRVDPDELVAGLACDLTDPLDLFREIGMVQDCRERLA